MPNDAVGWARRRLAAVRTERAAAKKNPDIIATIQREAEENEATLASDGKGGLDPSLALEVFRRDEWMCQIPNCETPKEDLDLDHIGGHPHELLDDPEADAWLQEQAQKGKQDEPDGIHVLCLRHHDMVHQRERALEHGKEPPPMAD